MQCRLEGWEDGQMVQVCLDGLDRNQAQAAERVTVQLHTGIEVIIHQKPHTLQEKLDLGACVWDGALVLTEYVSQLEVDLIKGKISGGFVGTRCVELGSGVGLVGLVMASLGATVFLTDKNVNASRVNIAKNWLAPGSNRRGGDSRGTAEAVQLEWDSAKGLATAQELGKTAVDWVLMSDCVYVDPVTGEVTPSQALMEVAAALCSATTICLVSYEVRSSDVRAVLLETAGRSFAEVQLVDTSKQRYQGPHVEVYRLACPHRLKT